MEPLDRNITDSPCPQPATLIDFGVGKLTQVEIDAVADHLNACDSCRTALDAFQHLPDSDGLISTIKKCFEQPTPPAEIGCLRLEAAVLELGLTPSDDQPTAPVGERRRRPRPALPASIGPYAVIRWLGDGGMGVVYEAVQLPIDRRVAVKMIRAGVHRTSSDDDRFLTEAKAIARLRHPNVVQIYDFGYDGNLPYFSMELVDGGSLKAKLDRGPLAPRKAAELLQTLAEALAYAHQEKVVHRDLKPGNILLTRDGVPKVADFGLAKLLDSSEDRTKTGVQMGTPGYMAPEQAEGKTKIAFETADVYALGTILYEALAGRPAFKGDSRTATLNLVRHARPTPPSKIQSDVPRDLEAICLKCLEKRPRDRYPTAQALADDLGRWLDGQRPTGAHRSWGQRARRMVSGRAAVIVLGLAMMALAAGTAGVIGISTRSHERPERVVLIGANGNPKTLRQRAGQAQLSLTKPDKYFSIRTRSTYLLELRSNPGLDRYCLTAWVRHEEGHMLGEVGVYATHRAYVAGANEIHVFAKLTFNDVVDYANLPMPAKLEEKVNRPPGNMLRLCGEILGELSPPWKHTSPRVWEHFQPTGPSWRKLELIVTPRGFQGTLDGQLVVELGLAEVAEELNKHFVHFPEADPRAEFVKSITPRFDTGGGLGLYLYNATASFRDVQITPIDEVDQH